jgi:NAD(P)-dependent dehydrogenase (short-subunit alcohol dehydrogenase family)
MSIKDPAPVVVITGASSGIGKAAARKLAAAGWRVIGLGRNPQRCAAAQAEISAAASPGIRVDMILADLSLMSDAARAAREVHALTGRIDVLLNNAGGVVKERVVTPDGNESTFAGNHLGHFLLTNRLLPLLRAAVVQPGDVRIISVSSKGHEMCPGLDWSDLQRLGNFTSGGAYCNAKLANILFTRALARRVGRDGIVAHAMHPGVVDSNFASHADEAMQNYFKTLQDVLVSPEVAADTLVWLATAAEPGHSNGGYYHQRSMVATSAAAQDDAAAERLWKESEALIARVPS